MSNIEDILKERQKTHGDFRTNAEISQNLKRIIRYENYPMIMTDEMVEALDVICAKIARILAGDSSHVDHWRDIAGYATLIQNILEKKEEKENGST